MMKRIMLFATLLSLGALNACSDAPAKVEPPVRPVVTMTAHAATALKQDFRPRKTPMEQAKESKRLERESQWRQKMEATENKAQEDRELRRKAEYALRELPEKRLSVLQTRFVEEILAASPYLKTRYERHGLQASGIRHLYLRFVGEQLLRA